MGSFGIGRDLAHSAAKDGHDLIVVARRADRPAALADELSALDTTTQAVTVDLALPTGAQAVEKAVAARPVDVLVNTIDAGRVPGPKTDSAAAAMVFTSLPDQPASTSVHDDPERIE